jgi:hypothetical protein
MYLKPNFSLVIQTSNREKLEIAQHFLLSSPPGQFNEVLTGKDSAPYHERQLPDLHIIVRGL